MTEQGRPLYQLTVEEFKQVFFQVIRESVEGIVKENIKRDHDNLLRIGEVQSMLKISRPSVYKLIREKKLRKYKVNGSTFFKRENVQALLADETNK